jgi:opacity protein-like surface antigen
MNSKTKIFIIISIILLLLISVSVAHGEERSSRLKSEAGMGYFLGGVGMLIEHNGNSVIYSTGGGGHALYNIGLIIGGEGHACFGPSNAGGYGFFNIGYAVISNEHLMLYPMLGIGGGAMTREGNPSVSKCALVNPSLRFDYLIHIKNNSGVLLGLHAGYTFTIYSNTFRWSKPYIRLAIGGFGISE